MQKRIRIVETRNSPRMRRHQRASSTNRQISNLSVAQKTYLSQHDRSSNQEVQSSPQFDSRDNKTTSSSAKVTFHRIDIRSSTISIQNGFVRARVRYFIQLHETVVGPHKLDFEVRLNPDYPPMYIGTVEDVCTYWPADAPGSQCSLHVTRFYQNGKMCICHMPPGLYHQRFKLNFGSILNGMEVPQFLFDLLFNGQKLNIYVTIRLKTLDNDLAACVQVKLPVHFK